MPHENETLPSPDRSSVLSRRLRVPPRITRWVLIVGVIVAIKIAYSPRDRFPNLSKPPRYSSTSPGRLNLRFSLLNSEFSQKLRRQSATDAYWKVAVADLHPYRFFYVEDPNEPVGRFYQRLVENLGTKVRAARTHSTDHVDEDLVELAQRHLAEDEAVLRLLSRFREFAAERGLLDDPTSVSQQLAQGEQIVNQLITAPGQLDQIEDREARALLEALFEVDAVRSEQLREIELLQARLQERYPSLSGTLFSLPAPPE